MTTNGNTAGPRGAPVPVTVVHAPACHFCADAEEALAELGRDYPLRITRLDINSPEGEALVREHRAPMSPLVLVDGKLFGWGRLSRRKLRRLLESRTATSPAAVGRVGSPDG